MEMNLRYIDLRLDPDFYNALMARATPALNFTDLGNALLRKALGLPDDPPQQPLA
jgi:hypothetical protein